MLRLGCLTALTALAGACGARSDLDAFAAGETTDPTGGGGGGGSVVSPPAPCDLFPAGPAIELVSFPDRHAVTPSLVVTDDGGTERVFVQTLASGGTNPAHPDIQLLEHQIGPAWPGGVALVTGPSLYGIESHSYGVLARGPASRQEIGLAWHGDPGGYGRAMFRRFDLTSGTALPPTDLATDGETVVDLVAGDDGWALAWRRSSGGSGTVAVAVALANADGIVTVGPLPLTSERPYPGLSTSLAFSGTTFLTATSFESCLTGEPLCRERSVVVVAVDPVTGSPELAAALEIGDGASASRPSLASWGGRTYVAWSEGVGEETANRRVRLAELTSEGALRAGPIDVEAGIEMSTRPVLVAGETGVTVAWNAPGDHALPPDVAGHDKLVISHLDASMLLQSSQVEVGVPLLTGYGPPSGGALRTPRGVVFVVGARLAGSDGYDGVHAARFDCR